MKIRHKHKESLELQLTDALRQLSELRVFKEKCQLMEVELRQQNDFVTVQSPF